MNKNKWGKVYLIGAGPGDPSLITVRGRDLVSRVDVIVVDDLVNPILLQLNPSAKIIYVGKRGPGSPQGSFLKLPQTGINNLLVSLAKKGQSVARLKGGDPIIFARGGEEMEALHRAGVSFEVVPGVTSAVAAPAYAGIPLSDRRWSSTITFLTGQESLSPNVQTSGVEWEKLSPQGTLAILMGVGQWKNIRKKLLSLGWPASKPVAAVQSATTSGQKVLITTLSQSIYVFQNEKLVSPAILIVGDVSRLGNRLSWIEKEKPLLGITVVVTRPVHQSYELKQALEDKGAFVVSCPAIAVEPLIDDPYTSTIIKNIKKGSLSYDWFIFLSENGVRSFHALVGSGRAWMGNGKLMAVGPRTRESARAFGWPVRHMAEIFNSGGIIKAIGNVKGKRILVPRVQRGPKDLIATLRKRGAHVDEIATYRTISAPAPGKRLKEFILKGVNVVTFTSGSTVENFMKFFSPQEGRKIFSRASALSIGPVTTSLLKKNKVKRIVQAAESTPISMVQALLKKKPK